MEFSGALCSADKKLQCFLFKLISFPFIFILLTFTFVRTYLWGMSVHLYVIDSNEFLTD